MVEAAPGLAAILFISPVSQAAQTPDFEGGRLQVRRHVHYIVSANDVVFRLKLLQAPYSLFASVHDLIVLSSP